MLPDFLLPYSAVDTRNPIFRQMWRHLRLINTEARLRRFNQFTLIGIPLTAVLWWLIERLNVNFSYLSSDFSSRLAHLILIAAFIIMGISSLSSLPRVMGWFNAQFNSAYWDTVRLTPQYNTAILMSHDAVAQLRLWPFTAVEVSLRIAVVIVFTLNSLYEWLHSNPLLPEGTARTLLNLSYLTVWSIRLFAAIALIVEPIFRARLIIALQLWMASRIRNIPILLLTGFALLSILHTVQLFVMVALYGLFQAFSAQEVSVTSALVCFLPLSTLSIILFWALYRRLRQNALDLAYKAAFRQD